MLRSKTSELIYQEIWEHLFVTMPSESSWPIAPDIADMTQIEEPLSLLYGSLGTLSQGTIFPG